MGAREVLLTIRNWMSGLRKAVLVNSLKAWALAALAGFVALSLVIMTTEAIGHFPGGVRAVFLVLWVISALAALGLGLVWPVLRYTIFAPDDKTLARMYASRMVSIRDRVLNALQLLERVEGANKEGYSTDLILEAGRGVAEDLKPIDPHSLPDRQPVLFGRKLALAVGAVALVLFVFAGGHLLSAANRVMKPGQEFLPPAPFNLDVKPGDVTLVRGDSLVVTVTGSGSVPETIYLERLEKGKSATEPVELKNESGIFHYTYRGVTAPFTYWAHQAQVKTETYDVAVQELPGVKYLSLRLTPPAYTNLPEQMLDENVGDIAAVVGTKVKLQLAATKSLKAASLEFLTPTNAVGDSSSLVISSEPQVTATQPLTLDGARADGEFTVGKSGYYRIKLSDNESLANRDPILYRITARPDEVPTVSLVQPAHDVDIAANVKVPVVAEAVDDFGFTRMTLRYHRPAAGEPPEISADELQYKSLPLPYKLIEPGKAEGTMEWDLSSLDLLPEDQVMFFVEVWDNDGIHGPKRGRSETRILRYPSMAEMFDKQDQQAQTREISLSDLLKESQDLREKVDEAVQDYKSNPDMSWERKQEVEKLLQRQAAMNEMLNQISDAMKQAAQQQEQRAMFSPQVMDKFNQLQQLIQEVITPEMRKALDKLAQAMKQPSEEEMRKALENFQMTQDMFEKALDQTMNMLKQLKVAQKLDEMTRRLDELGRRQDQLNEKMDQNNPENAQKNAEEQQKLAEEMRKIEQEAQKLAEQMKKEGMQGQQKMAELQKQMEQEQLSQQMQQNSQTMQMCQNQSAKKKGRHARQKMADMAQQMQDIRQQMDTDQNAEVLEKLERARDQILDLSMRQEQLYHETENLESGSPQLSQAAEEQENLRQALGRVSEDLQKLARESMFVTPQLMGGIFGAMMQMQQAGQAAQGRDSRTASYYRRQALGALNSSLKESNNACSSCKSSCNKPNPNSMCNKAGMMASQQRQLNQQTQDLMSQCNNPGSLTMGEQAAMQRIAVSQKELSKSAEQLSQEAQASQQSLGRLEDAVKEMQDVTKDLENRNVTQQTMQKQEHIESRLLDFQRAQREREFSPRRQSNPGVDVVRASPGPLPDKPGQDQLREDLLRALDAKYTPDYEQLIRAYFDALSKWK